MDVPANTLFPSPSLRQRVPGLLTFVLVFALSLTGLLMLFSVGRSLDEGRQSTFVVKQTIWLGVGLAAFFVTYRLNLEKLRPLVWLMGVGGLVLLVLVLVPGIGLLVNGARRWISLGFMNMQVSDFAKIAFLFVLARYLSDNQRHMGEFVRGYVIPLTLVAIPCGLILLQPDFGTAALFGLVGGLLLFLGGARLLYLIPSGIAAVSLFAVAIYHDPVRFRRVMSFMDVEAHRNDATFQLWQGLIAFGSGGLSGRGIGQGRQQMAFLPEAHTDFIFPIIGEELGLIATGAITLAFLALFMVGMTQLLRATNRYQFVLGAGALFFIIFQAIVNMGVATGLMPTKGMSLPFISYGGSNLVTMFILTGLLLNCFEEWNRERPLAARERRRG
jgi:cell division protein FtsW